METKEIPLKLTPEERFKLVEGIMFSIDKPDEAIDNVWLDEAERRLDAYRAGRLEGVPMEEVFGDD